MVDQSGGAWYSDPSGRYAQRWHDGVTWTPSVADSSGQVLHDDGPTTASPIPSMAPASYTTPTTAAPGPPVYGAPATVDRRGRWLAGLVLAVAGAAVLALSLFVLNWYEDIQDHPRTFSDVQSLFDLPDGDPGSSWTERYTDFGWILGLLAVGAAVATAVVRWVGLLRPVGALCVFGAVLHGATAANVGTLIPGDGFTVLPGAWIGCAGYALAAVGAFLAASSRP